MGFKVPLSITTEFQVKIPDENYSGYGELCVGVIDIGHYDNYKDERIIEAVIYLGDGKFWRGENEIEMTLKQFEKVIELKKYLKDRVKKALSENYENYIISEVLKRSKGCNV